VCFHVVDPDGTMHDFTLGAHVPRLSDADVDMIHALWLDATNRGGIEDLHHREVVTVALARLVEEMKGTERVEALQRMRSLVGKRRVATFRG